MAEDHAKSDLIISWILMVCSICMVLGGLAILSFQAVLWLRDGFWTDYPLAYIVPKNPRYDWRDMRGAEKIFDWFREFPISVCLIAIGVFGIWKQGLDIKEAERTLSLRGGREAPP